MQNPNQSPKDQTPVDSFPIALIVGVFNREITQALQKGVIEQLTQRGIHTADIFIYEVPGAIEIPLVAKRLALQNKVQAIIALGSVIRGETSHYDLVCNVASEGCMQVSLAHNLPILFGVLTTENEAQAWDRLGGKHGHKGVELADAAISVHQLLKQIH